MFIIELMTRDGKICENYPSYEEALARINGFPLESLAGMPMIFQELPDGSQRLIRQDQKPLQWHRLPEDHVPVIEEPLPLLDPLADVGSPILFDENEEPLPLLDPLPGQENRTGPNIRVIWIKSEEEEGLAKQED